MPSRKSDKVQITCPHCGNRQLESRAAISTNCRKCRQYFRVQEELSAAAAPPKPTKPRQDQRTINCFDCDTTLEVAVTAESTMCKRCSSYIDLKDYRIDSAVSKNFRTKGTFVVEPKGYVFNTEAVVEHAVIKGRFLGKMDARGSLTLHTGAEIKGSFTTAKLIIPKGNHFDWSKRIRSKSVEIAGELVANLSVFEVLHLRSTGRLFGDVEAKNFVMEEGAIVVGQMKIGGQ